MKDKRIDHGQGLVEYIWYWDNGNIRNHYTMLNNEIYGEFRCYNKNGILYAHTYYKKGKRGGECLEYYDK